MDLSIFIFNLHWLLLYLFWNYIIVWTNIWDCYVPWGIHSFVIIKYNSLSLIIPFALKPGFDFFYCFSSLNIIDFCFNFYYSYPCLGLICSYVSIFLKVKPSHIILLILNMILLFNNWKEWLKAQNLRSTKKVSFFFFLIFVGLWSFYSCIIFLLFSICQVHIDEHWLKQSHLD